jgi:hypothetical protein
MKVRREKESKVFLSESLNFMLDRLLLKILPAEARSSFNNCDTWKSQASKKEPFLNEECLTGKIAH